MPELTDERMCELLEECEQAGRLHYALEWDDACDLAAALRELRAYREVASEEHPMGLSLQERVAQRMEEGA